MTRNLLVLDIDETLLYAVESPLSRTEDFRVGRYCVYLRPFLGEFITSVFEWFDVAVWTSAGADYAAGMIDRMIPSPERLKFVWSSERCTRRFNPETHESFWIKDFKKIKRAGFNLDRVVVVDDSPEKHGRNLGNLILVAPFTGDAADSELQNLLPYLKSLGNVANVRTLEKRNWRATARILRQADAPNGK